MQIYGKTVKSQSVKCCEYLRLKTGIMTQCGKRANYRKLWNYCPYCGKPIAVMFNDDDIKSI